MQVTEAYAVRLLLLLCGGSICRLHGLRVLKIAVRALPANSDHIENANATLKSMQHNVLLGARLLMKRCKADCNQAVGLSVCCSGAQLAPYAKYRLAAMGSGHPRTTPDILA